MSAESHVASGPSATEYIQHHLQHLQKDFSFQSVKQTSIVDFSVFNLDSVFFALVLGVLGCFVMWRAARRVTAGVPGRFQAAIEIMVEMADNQAKGVIHNATSRKLVAPLALTVFVWIFLMNFMDMLPVDLIPHIWHSAGPALGFKDYMRVVPTADLSTTLGLSVSVLFVCLVYNVKIKGLGGWSHELIAAPFGDKWFLYPVNFLMLIALMGGVWAWEFNPLAGGFWLGVGHVIAGTVWTLFHILVITLQAFIFMMLTLIYVGQAHDAH
jgi:F-type H+-transporting ATPase subunit a